MAAVPDTNLWDQTWDQVNKICGGGEKLQLVYPFVDWTWPIPKSGYIDSTAYNILAQIPKWSAIGKYSPSADDLYSNYCSMIAKCPSLTITDDLRQQIREADDQYTQAQNTWDSDVKAANYAFSQAQDVPPGVPKPVYAEWMQSSGWEDRLKADRVAIDKANETKALIVKQQNPEYKDAIAASTMPTDKYASKPGFLKCNVNGNDEWRAGFLVNNGQDWKAQLSRGGNSLSIELDASKIANAMKTSWAGGSADFGTSFFGIYANGSWQDFKLTENDSNVKATINIKAVTQVPVRPGQWYKSGYLAGLARDNKWNQPYTTTGGESPVFGKGGLLPLMITGLVAGYQISFSISMSASAFERHASTFSGSGGIRIGPFHIGGGGSTSSDSWEKDASGTRFTGESKATYPFIIGFAVAQPGLE